MFVGPEPSDHFFLPVTDCTGSGTTEVFQVFPGIFLMYNDFHLKKCKSAFVCPQNFWGVEHCRCGKTEWQMEDGNFAYLGSGALMPCDYQESEGEFSFPGNLYEGLALGFAMPDAASSLPAFLNLDLYALQKKLMNGSILDLSGDPQSDAVLRLLYRARFQSTLHRQLACMEFLVFLQDLKPTALEPFYLPRQHVETIKQIEGFLTSHLEHRWTLPELSDRFHLPVSVLRRNFSGIYGMSVAEYMRKIRIERAKHLLLDQDCPITEIAMKLGYENASKFSSAFRQATDLSPRSYRLQNR